MIANLWLLLRNIVAIVLFPGVVTVYIPYLILRPVRLLAINEWSISQIGSSLVILAGLTILMAAIWPFAYRGRGTLAPFDETRQLIVSGLHRYVRNPMYIGVMLMLIGESWFFQSLEMLWYSLVFFLIINIVVVAYEENRLRFKYGEEYEQYLKNVGRWIPRRPAIK